jgi:hypothetical protein
MGCSPYFKQLKEIDQALSHILRAGLGPLSAPYEALYKVRGEVMGKLGLKAVSVRRVLPILKLLALSPGELEVFFDIEVGWIAQGTPRPGAPPVIRRISHEEAELLLSPRPPTSLVHRLLEPETYFGE